MSSVPEQASRDIMVLRTSLTSPFGRKVRMAASVLGLSERIEIERASTVDEADTIRTQNPLGKIPCLLLNDGTAIYDSRTIIDYLCDVAVRNSLFPSEPLALAKERTLVVLADGVTDAALLMVYEGRFRTAEQYSERWMRHQCQKIARALSQLEGAPPPLGAHLRAGGISLACALGYLDWRQPVEWRGRHPRLVAWLDAFETRHPALAATNVPHDEGGS